jgi:hypothetical protein
LYYVWKSSIYEENGIDTEKTQKVSFCGEDFKELENEIENWLQDDDCEFIAYYTPVNIQVNY